MPTRSPDPVQRSDRVTSLLAASVIGVYVLVVIGATTSVLDGQRSCSSWPACNGEWMLSLSNPGLLAAWGHRLAAVLVAVLLVGTIVTAWRNRVRRRVQLALGTAAVLYPLQVTVGAWLAVTGTGGVYAIAHLVVAMVIVSGLLLALLWHLETTVAGTSPIEDGSPTTSVEVADPPSDPSGGTSYPEAGVLPRLKAYLVMTKPRLMWLLCLVAVAAMGLAAGPALQAGTVVATLAGGVLAVGASGTFNNVFERDVDAEMERTADRPLVQQQIPVWRAISFGVVLTLASIGVFVAFVNLLAAALGVLAILFYSVIYTVVLKPHTTQNIVIGGAVGAFPALIGWAAVTETVGVPAIVLGAVVFLWTPAHFYNLALAYRDDYERAGFPMLSVVRGAATTRRHILLYLGATLLGAVVLGATTTLGWVYAATIVLVGGVFLWAVLRLFYEQTERSAFRAFHASNAYLGGLLLAVVVDTLLV